VEIGPKGKKVGRGAYLCPKLECWETGLTKNRLDHALHVKISRENRQVWREHARSLLKKEV